MEITFSRKDFLGKKVLQFVPNFNIVYMLKIN